LNGFDTLVGKITNYSTSINAMLPKFPKEQYPEEYNELIKRLKLLREIIGAEIDKIKLGVAPEFPQEWIQRVEILDDDSDIEKAKKYKNNSMVVHQKAYFMIYLYENLYNSYSNHVKQFELDCKNKFGMSCNELKYLKNKTNEQRQFLWKMDYFSPIIDTPCVMNKICHKFEKLERDIKFDKNNNKSVLKQFNKKEHEINQDVLANLIIIYKQYQTQKKFLILKLILEEVLNEDDCVEYISTARDALIDEYQQECNSQISNNTQELFEYMLAMAETFENSGTEFNYSFIWDILDEDILNVIPQDKSLICLEDINGQEYLGRKYKLVEVKKDDNLG
jgi:hypothetical protein